MSDVATRPAEPLSPEAREGVVDALVRSYTVEDLDHRLGFKLGLRLEWEIDTRGGSRQVYARLLDWSEENGRSRQLLAVAWSGKPGNTYLARAAEQLLTQQERAAAAELYGAGRLPPKEPSLEAAVSARSKLFDYAGFLKRLTGLGQAICRIDTPHSKGTGFLVGRRSVLTNFHVIAKAKERNAPGGDIRCTFDFWQDGAKGAGRPLEGEWLRSWSPYSQSDLSGAGAPKDDELDYALLRLADPVEDSRPALAFPEAPPRIEPGDLAMIAQHPGGEALSMAYGAITAFPASGLRYRYDVTTEPGSSGSPVFSVELDLIGLHHAAEPSANPSYNQGVPIARIGRALRDGAVDLGAL